MAKLMRNLRKLAADRRPKVSTIMTIRLPTKAITEVVEYKMTREVRVGASKSSKLENAGS